MAYQDLLRKETVIRAYTEKLTRITYAIEHLKFYKLTCEVCHKSDMIQKDGKTSFVTMFAKKGWDVQNNKVLCVDCKDKPIPLPKSKANQNKKTHCRHGHAYTEDNTYMSPQGIKECFICKKARARNRIR